MSFFFSASPEHQSIRNSSKLFAPDLQRLECDVLVFLNVNYFQKKRRRRTKGTEKIKEKGGRFKVARNMKLKRKAGNFVKFREKLVQRF